MKVEAGYRLRDNRHNYLLVHIVRFLFLIFKLKMKQYNYLNITI